MRIAVIGAGAVGCFYGTRLLRAGHDVHFLMRSDLQTVRADGLSVQSPEGDFFGPVQAHATADAIGPSDLVVCALKATAIDVAAALVAPCVGPSTQILVLMNGLGVEAPFAERLGAHRVFGGMAFVCINRTAPGVVRHLAYGRLSLGHVLDDERQTESLADVLRQAGIEVVVPESLNVARWEKLAWNIPFSTLAVSAGGVSTRTILDDSGLRELAHRLMAETIAAANADGCAIEPGPLIERMFDLTETMGPYRPSMLIDFERKQPLEVEAILGEPVRRAAASGVSAPHLTMNYYLVRMLDQVNRGVLTG